jgi:hypothetical protein
MQSAPHDVMMTKTVRRTFHSIGDRSGDIAKAISCGTADAAKWVGRGTTDLATRIGPKRGLIGLAVLAAAVGGTIVLVRYLRARNAEYPLEMEENVAGATGRGARRRRAQAQQANDSRAF